jgi:hypothetical protein
MTSKLCIEKKKKKTETLFILFLKKLSFGDFNSEILFE